MVHLPRPLAAVAADRQSKRAAAAAAALRIRDPLFTALLTAITKRCGLLSLASRSDVVVVGRFEDVAEMRKE